MRGMQISGGMHGRGSEIVSDHPTPHGGLLDDAVTASMQKAWALRIVRTWTLAR